MQFVIQWFKSLSRLFMTSEIQTAGYEGLSIAEFVERLSHAGTKTVLDVRANPISRKPGFSKNSFAKHLSAAGIQYVHCPKMGCPKKVRDRYKADGDWTTYTKGFLKYLAEQDNEVAQVAKLAATRKSCLVCFESDFNFCHRTFVARAVSNVSSLRIVHLIDRKAVSDPGLLGVAA